MTDQVEYVLLCIALCLQAENIYIIGQKPKEILMLLFSIAIYNQILYLTWPRVDLISIYMVYV